MLERSVASYNSMGYLGLYHESLTWFEVDPRPINKESKFTFKQKVILFGFTMEMYVTVNPRRRRDAMANRH
jgi:hypothetical protein